MAGTQPLTNIQLGVEAVYGTAVARTQKFYGVSTGSFDPNYGWATHEGENRGVKTRSSRAPSIVRVAPKLRLQDVDGIGYDDLILPFSAGIEGGQTGTGPTAFTWQFTAQNTVSAAYESLCADIGDDIQNFVIAGLVPESWTISATAGEPTHFSMDCVGTSITKGAATSLSNASPVQIPSGLWTLKHAATFAGLSAASVVDTFLRSFSLTWNPGRPMQYYLNGSLGGQPVESYLEGTLSMEVDSTALAISEYWDNWLAAATDFIRLEVTSDEALGGSNYKLGFDMPVRFNTVKPISSESDGINRYAIEAGIIYDPTSTKSLEANLIASRGTIA